MSFYGREQIIGWFLKAFHGDFKHVVLSGRK